MMTMVRNEIKAQIVRAGYTMQEVVDRLHEEYGGRTVFPTCPPSSSGGSSATRRSWNWPMCWGMTFIGAPAKATPLWGEEEQRSE